MLTQEELDSRVIAFKEELRKTDSQDMVGKHILFGESVMLSNDAYFDLRKAVSKFFDIEQNDVVMVGSAKIGFTITDRPEKNRPRYSGFADHSDIDLAICSDDLFCKLWNELVELEMRAPVWPSKKEFLKYFFRGWIRPDKLPEASSYGLSKEWWDFFQSLRSSRRYGPYKITAGVYYSRKFLERYQVQAVQECKIEL